MTSDPDRAVRGLKDYGPLIDRAPLDRRANGIPGASSHRNHEICQAGFRDHFEASPPQEGFFNVILSAGVGERILHGFTRFRRDDDHHGASPKHVFGKA